MTTKINGRTPEEIKRGLEPCKEANCSACFNEYNCKREAEALAYIQQLERERDAAVEGLCKIHDILFKHGWTVTVDCVCEIRETIVHAIVDVPHTEVE